MALSVQRSGVHCQCDFFSSTLCFFPSRFLSLFVRRPPLVPRPIAAAARGRRADGQFLSSAAAAAAAAASAAKTNHLRFIMLPLHLVRHRRTVAPLPLFCTCRSVQHPLNCRYLLGGYMPLVCAGTGCSISMDAGGGQMCSLKSDARTMDFSFFFNCALFLLMHSCVFLN